MTTIYISGGMSNYPDHNFPAFNRAAEFLREVNMGRIEVINPADTGIVEGWSWSDYLRYDLRLLVKADSIYMLKGWEDSKGACLERHVAIELGMDILYER